ncbi:hypothetical protein HMPREF1248_1512 [Coriobacteriaceae bacterium BV3Ac1]|nr:hypothetical protein HMPREF1248_1512 [Coriobacteriaceae bacterium BV3Ac1]
MGCLFVTGHHVRSVQISWGWKLPRVRGKRMLLRAFQGST